MSPPDGLNPHSDMCFFRQEVERMIRWFNKELKAKLPKQRTLIFYSMVIPRDPFPWRKQ